MAGSERKRQKKREEKNQKRRERKAEKQRKRDQNKALMQHFSGSFVEEYERVRKRALQEHPSLIDIFDCEDAVFYTDTQEQLAHFGYGHLSRVIFNAAAEDGIDFDADPSSESGELNANRSQPKADESEVTGRTTIVTDGKIKSSLIFMRKATGGVRNPEVAHGTKLCALLHELGHVSDFEQQLNYHENSIDVVKAEVFAHHYACKSMIRGGYRLSLGYYLEGLQGMANSESEFVSRAANQVIQSPEFKRYWNESRIYRAS